MSFLAGAMGLVGSLFGARPSYGGVSDPGMQSLLAESNLATEESMKTGVTESIKTTQEAMVDGIAVGQSSRAASRAISLSTIEQRHEGLVESIQQSQSKHITAAMDIIKQA